MENWRQHFPWLNDKNSSFSFWIFIHLSLLQVIVESDRERKKLFSFTLLKLKRRMTPKVYALFCICLRAMNFINMITKWLRMINIYNSKLWRRKRLTEEKKNLFLKWLQLFVNKISGQLEIIYFPLLLTCDGTWIEFNLF